MSEFPIHPVPVALKTAAHINARQYREMYACSVSDPDGFWADQATEFLDWEKPWNKVCQADLHKGEVS